MSKPKTLTKMAATRRRNAALRRRRQRKTAEGRLSTDGATDLAQMRRRLQWLAHVWQIPPDEVPQVTNCPTKALKDFARKHQITFEWLISGDLKASSTALRRPALSRPRQALARPARYVRPK